MSELKAGVVYADFNRNIFLYHGTEEKDSVLEDDEEVYKKSEADRYIAHQKYKRCVAMALVWLERAENSTDLENELVSQKRYSKWMELAQKFKPNNSTAQ